MEKELFEKADALVNAIRAYWSNPKVKGMEESMPVDSDYDKAFAELSELLDAIKAAA